MYRLDEHQIIALDMDATLVDGVHSHHLREYVQRNRSKDFHVITFRDTPDWVASVRRDLQHAGLDPAHIKEVVGCPYGRHVLRLKAAARSLSFFGIRKLAESYGFRLEDIEPMMVRYCEWKGKTAAELGCTVLVDDLPELVLPGCRRYGIQFLDANELTVPLRVA